MANYAHIANGKIYRRLSLTPREASGIPPHKRKYIIPIVEDSRPTFDKVTHHPPVRSEKIEEGQVSVTWADPVAKTQEESDEIKDELINAVDRVSFKVMMLQENRIRVLEGKPTLSADEFRASVRAIL